MPNEFESSHDEEGTTETPDLESTVGAEPAAEQTPHETAPESPELQEVLKIFGARWNLTMTVGLLEKISPETIKLPVVQKILNDLFENYVAGLPTNQNPRLDSLEKLMRLCDIEPRSLLERPGSRDVVATMTLNAYSPYVKVEQDIPDTKDIEEFRASLRRQWRFEPEQAAEIVRERYGVLPQYGMSESVNNLIEKEIANIVEREAERQQITRVAAVFGVEEPRMVEIVKRTAPDLLHSVDAIVKFGWILEEFNLGKEYLTSPETEAIIAKQFAEIKIPDSYYYGAIPPILDRLVAMKQAVEMDEATFLSLLRSSGLIGRVVGRSHQLLVELFTKAEVSQEGIQSCSTEIIKAQLERYPAGLERAMKELDLSPELLKTPEVIEQACVVVKEKLSTYREFESYRSDIESRAADIGRILELIEPPATLVEPAMAEALVIRLQKKHSRYEASYIKPLVERYPGVRHNPELRTFIRSMAITPPGEHEYSHIENVAAWLSLVGGWDMENDTELREAALGLITPDYLSGQYSHQLRYVISLLKAADFPLHLIPEEMRQQAEFAANKALADYSGFKDGLDAIEVFGLDGSKLQEGFTKALDEVIKKDKEYGAATELQLKEIESIAKLDRSVTQKILLEALGESWQYSRHLPSYPLAQHLFRAFEIDQEAVERAFIDKVINIMSTPAHGHDPMYFVKEAKELILETGIGKQEITSLAQRTIVRSVANKNLHHADLVREAWQLEDITEFPWQEESPTLFSMINVLGLSSWTHFSAMYREHEELIEQLLEQNREWVLAYGLMDRGKELALNDRETHACVAGGVSLHQPINDAFWEKVVQTLREAPIQTEWSNEEVTHHFDTGAEVFGVNRMMWYLKRENLSRHDGLLAIDSIVNMQKQSGLSPETFFTQILQQVLMDDRTYEEGTAHHHFNALANRGILPLDEVRRIIAGYEFEVQQECEEALSAFTTQEDIYASWRALKAYHQKVDQVINGVARLRQVASLRAEGHDRLAEWYRVVSASTTVETNALVEFLTDPAKFLKRSASFTPEHLHRQKRPSNYTEINHLDLSAEELRDALVEGDLDRLQSLPPFELLYRVAAEGKVVEEGLEQLPTPELVKTVLGSRREKIASLTADGGKRLFGQLRELINTDHLSSGGSGKIDVVHLLDGNYVPSAQADAWIRQACLVAVDKNRLDRGTEYVVAIHPKSSPHGVLAGNDTACCMPFGDGKANEYMFNPACAQFTIQEARQDGTRRTLVQSVMTLNAELHRNVRDVLNAMEHTWEDSGLSNNLSEQVLALSPRLVVADNAEANPNFKGHISAHRLSELLYGDFFARYLPQIAKTQHVDTNQVLIGEHYSDVLNHLPRIPNTTLPVAPLSYSDNTANTSYQLTPRLATDGSVSVNIEIPVPPRSERAVKVGVSDLTFEDALQTAYLEGKVYEDNSSLVLGLHEMQNFLIAKDVSNAHKKRPNLSFKYLDSNGALGGYILAYEGRKGLNEDKESEWDDYGYDYDDEEENEGKGGQLGVTSIGPSSKMDAFERVVYVVDLASQPWSKMAGGRLIRQFIQSYRENYLDKGDLVPLFLQARESTSYKIIKSHLDKIAQQTGLVLIPEELRKYRQGKDIMHEVIIRPYSKGNEPSTPPPVLPFTNSEGHEETIDEVEPTADEAWDEEPEETRETSLDEELMAEYEQQYGRYELIEEEAERRV